MLDAQRKSAIDSAIRGACDLFRDVGDLGAGRDLVLALLLLKYLSDTEQRRIYDEVFAQETQRWQAERDAQEAQERAAQRERERIAQEHYEKMVATAMRFADDGHNRDTLFGVLLGRDCEAELAARIADSVWAMQEARRASVAAAEAIPTPDEAPGPKADEATTSRRQPSTFESFWHGLFGLRP